MSLQLSTLIAGLALWYAGACLRHRQDMRPWISPTALAFGGYAIVMGVALCLRTALSA
jgi:hypothetical protein